MRAAVEHVRYAGDSRTRQGDDSFVLVILGGVDLAIGAGRRRSREENELGCVTPVERQVHYLLLN